MVRLSSTSCAVSWEPSENSTPSRTVSVHWVPEPDTVTRAGWESKVVVSFTGESYSSIAALRLFRSSQFQGEATMLS